MVRLGIAPAPTQVEKIGDLIDSWIQVHLANLLGPSMGYSRGGVGKGAGRSEKEKLFFSVIPTRACIRGWPGTLWFVMA